MSSHGITKENLLGAFPLALSGDDKVNALADVTAAILARRTKEIDLISLYAHIDELPEKLLDILAYDFKVDWYSYNYSLAAKRAMVKGNILAHKRQGTVYATRSVIESIYPRSEMEEWFQYGGRPGYFRLNVNISIANVTEPIEIQDKDKILQIINSVKRLSAHLEDVSFMVRNAIVVKEKLECFFYRPPFCGPTVCGTYWMRKCLGWSEKPGLSVGAVVLADAYQPDFSGTLPSVKTPGYSMENALVIQGKAEPFTDSPVESGMELTGTKWMDKQVGYSEGRTLLSRGTADAFNVSPELAGTLPVDKVIGVSYSGTMRAGGRVVVTPISPELTGTLPEEADHGA